MVHGFDVVAVDFADGPAEGVPAFGEGEPEARGGPAGAAAAIRAARAGARVTVFEKGQPGRDKICGDGLIPDSHRALARLGLLDEVIVQIGSATLGQGKPLLPRRLLSPVLQLQSVQQMGRGMAELRYTVCRAQQPES